MNQTNKVAVVGAGYWGKNLVRNFHALGAFDLVIDSSPVIQQAMADTYPGVRVSDSYNEALNDSKISGINIATPEETRGPLIREAHVSAPCRVSGSA